MKKVYISKSNEADPDNVYKIRDLLKNYDCNVIEHTGGQYDVNKVREADIMFFVPPATGWEVGGEYYEIGKGQHGEVEHFIDKNKPCFIVDFESGSFLTPSHVSISNLMDWKHYAELFIYEQFDSIEEVFGLVFQDVKNLKENPLTWDKVYTQPDFHLGTIGYFKNKAK